MRLKRLELQGYKTFAARTEFLFDSGITAIVGPNGSGKSNIADAIRWVLGEQSYRTLRGKRTEDMIFSGSAQRSRAGMASASLVLDNADGWLPIEFAQVVITRRAYRSGENEYLLNHSRVRLRDITNLLAKSGLARRTYTVIGQGLVDAVLSLRPDARRELFEEASGITLYRTRRSEALARLEETRANLLRVNDIINEIAPRLRRLEREAERAERRAMVQQQLDGLLRTWYGYRWRQAQLQLHRSRDALARRETSVAQRRQALEELDARAAALRARQARLREQLGDWHRQSAQLHREMEAVQRRLAVWRERSRLLARQGDEWQAEQTELLAQVQAAAERVSAAEEEAAAAQAALRERESRVAQAEATLAEHEARRAELAQRLAQAQADLLARTTQAADRRNRLAQLAERRAALAQERAEHETAIAEQQAQAESLRARLTELAGRQAQWEAERDALEERIARLTADLDRNRAHQADLSEQLAQARQEAERLQTRYELLSRLRAEGEGLYAGVRAVLQASRALPGVLGPVAQLLHVPAEYETAIEVALGGHLQDLVVESWSDAERAIAYLREGRRGRATFLPLDTVRPRRRLDAPREPGLVGVAADLVEAEARLAPVVEMLLGRTLVARDLKAARRLFDRLHGGFQIVTLAGEVLRSSGSVTGGRRRERAQGRMLAREREWRELPAQIEAAQGRRAQVEGALAGARQAETQARERLADLEKRRRAHRTAGEALQTQRREMQRDLDRVEQQRLLLQERLARLDREAARLDETEAALQADLAQLTAGQEEAEKRQAALQAELDGLPGEALYRRLSEARTAAAVAQGAWQHRRAALAEAQERLARLREQAAAKEQRIAQLAAERADLARRIEEQSAQEAAVREQLAALTAQIEPAEAELSRLEAEREALDAEEEALRVRLRQAENRHAQALLAHSRRQDRLERLRRQIMDDFGLVEMEPVEGMPEQGLLPLGEMVSALPVVETLPEGLEEEVHRLKAQLRRMGSVNPNAPQEYAEVLDRHTFLSTQAADLEEAAAGLRRVIAELDEVMRREFQATFRAVAARFKANFSELFGGGTARLVLTEPEDIGQTGVEIVARPPGKRPQALALLSGGERALTAVALIFAILEVSPPPFCILDEVDAMLDEANVRRFRRALETLAKKTQFIVITHNRGTIQAADTIYGVSMGDDSVSQVVSLRWEGDRIAAPDGSTVDVAKAG